MKRQRLSDHMTMQDMLYVAYQKHMLYKKTYWLKVKC